jgi:hypothetical protein
MTALHLSTHPWAAAPRTLLATFAVVTTLLVAAAVALVVLLSADAGTADTGRPIPHPPAKTCPGGPPAADC